MRSIDPPSSERVIVFAPTSRDAEVTCHLLDSVGIECLGQQHVVAIADEIQRGVGALILSDVALARDPAASAALDALASQPSWSNIPVVLACRGGQLPVSLQRLVDPLRNVTLLDRPTSTHAMLSVVQAALRGRRWQYQIRDQLVELQKAEAALRGADRRKDEFLAILAHELRNPLAPIRTALHVLGHVREDRERYAELVGMMDRQTTHLTRLVDELLDVSRISTGKIVLQRQHIDLRTVLPVALESVQPAIDAAGHTIEVASPADPVPVLGDPTRLAQALSNLLNNAAKYTPRGGHIFVTLERDAAEARFRVADNGAGIPAAMLDSVFDLFAQVDRTLDRAQGGLGIGLSLVRRLAELHGGRAEARSAGIGAGSTFTLHLPLAARSADEPSLESASAPALRRLRVLVVDDNEDAARALGLLVDTLGHGAKIEFGAELALRVVGDFAPDVVFSDIGMPGMDGLEFARIVRARERGRGRTSRLVAITGWGTPRDRELAKEAGFDHHITKPANLAQIQSILGDM